MSPNPIPSGSGPSAQRLADLLARLSADGITQAQVAQRAGVPAQYLSDVRHGRRPLSELFARRLAEEFDFNYSWLLGQEDSIERPRLAPTAARGAVLPVLPHPIEGDPHSASKWDGTYVRIPSTAASKLVGAVRPYVLRFGHNDYQGRLLRGDYILVSQSVNKRAKIQVVRSKNKCFLARQVSGRWIRLATREALTGEVVVVGHCVGIIWSALT